MARKPKIETEKQANGQGPEPAARGMAASTAAEPKTVESRSKAKKPASKKKAVRAIKSPAPKNTSLSASIYEPSDDEIRVRAYFISERRIQLALQGDSDHDWIEARRQLVEEAKRTAS